MTADERELYRSLRSERRWAIAERIALWVGGVALVIFLSALVCALTVVIEDDLSDQMPTQRVMDHQWPA